VAGYIFGNTYYSYYFDFFRLHYSADYKGIALRLFNKKPKSMNISNIYTIGYGARDIKSFISLLKAHKIDYLIDVRSTPYSKFNPKFNHRDLSYALKEHNITYVFMGDTLGGRPADETCYTEDGKVDYKKVETKDFYKTGIDRIKTAYKKGLNIVLMCSEANPSQCHRSKLIGMTLIKELECKNCLKHIDEFGKIKDQATVINEITKGKGPTDLFNVEIYTTSIKSYLNAG